MKPLRKAVGQLQVFTFFRKRFFSSFLSQAVSRRRAASSRFLRCISFSSGDKIRLETLCLVEFNGLGAEVEDDLILSPVRKNLSLPVTEVVINNGHSRTLG